MLCRRIFDAISSIYNWEKQKEPVIPFERKPPLLVLEKGGVDFLEKIANSRTEPYAEVGGARLLLAYSAGETISSIARKEQTDRANVERCVDKAFLCGSILHCHNHSGYYLMRYIVIFYGNYIAWIFQFHKVLSLEI